MIKTATFRTKNIKVVASRNANGTYPIRAWINLTDDFEWKEVDGWGTHTEKTLKDIIEKCYSENLMTVDVIEYTNEELQADINSCSRPRQRAAEKAYHWYRHPNNWKSCVDIFKAYKNPSSAKVRAWEYCKRLCQEHDGFALRIISHGVQTFSVGFCYVGKETGRPCFAYITRDYDSYCYVD